MSYKLGPDGMITRRGDAGRSEKAPADEFRFLYNSLTHAQNLLPEGITIEQPQGVMYYSPAHIEEINAGLAKLRLLQQAGLQEFTDVQGKISTEDAIAKVEKNVEFSEMVHRIPQNPVARTRSSEEAKKLLRKKLLGEKE